MYAQFISIKISTLPDSFSHLNQVSINEIDEYAVSRLMELFLEKLTK